MQRMQLLIVAVCFAAACNQSTVNTIAWLTQVVRNQTVSMAIDSKFTVPAQDQWDLSRENVTVSLEWIGAGGAASVTLTKSDGLRVIEAWQHPAAVVYLGGGFWDTDSRGWVAIVAFDIPGSAVIPNEDLPATVTVTVLKDGMEIPTGFGADTIGTQIVVVDGGSPPVLFPDPANLEPPPLLRLVAKTATGGGGFDDPAWLNPIIGSIEFEIEHPAWLTIRDAHPIADAAGATVTVGPGSVADRRKVVLVDPDGFVLDADEGRADVAGDGPFLDIAFEAGPFAESNFTIYDLVVADIDGNVLLEDAGDASNHFDLYVRGPRP